MSKTEIKNINNDVITIDNKIKSNENIINIVNEKINSLNSQLKYEIEAEQNKTNQKINNYKAKIDANGVENASIKVTKAALIKMANFQLKILKKALIKLAKMQILMNLKKRKQELIQD